MHRTYETEAVAVATWNTRPVEDALRAKVAYLESALEGAENNTHKALSAFNELDAKWESVPWDAIRTAAAFALVDPYFAGGPPAPIEFQVRIVEGWLADHAPEPPDKEPQP